MQKYGITILVIGFCLIFISVNSTLTRPTKVIIDTDAGGDDASAILLALAAEKKLKEDGFEVIAITCTYGNTQLKNVEVNVMKILTIAGRSDIPVYAGVHRPLLKNYTIDYYFGEDGLGDFDFGEPILGRIDRSKHASVAMVDLARKHAGNVSVIALGPVTNVAIAITLDPNFVNNVKRFYIMGSSVYGIGNIAPNIEFNFYQDPQSNFVVLNSTRGLPAVLFPWESGLSASIPMEWRTDVLGAIDSRIICFLNQVEKNTFANNIWRVVDLMMTALVIWPELIISSVVTNVTPVFDGAAQGSVLVDFAKTTDKPDNVEILKDFNVKGFQQILLHFFS